MLRFFCNFNFYRYIIKGLGVFFFIWRLYFYWDMYIRYFKGNNFLYCVGCKFR